jgi:hypothetical protein
MDNPVNPSATSSPPSQKPRKTIWLWISLGIACLCVMIPLIAIVIDPTYLNLLKTGAPQVKINVGTYDGTIYTAPDENFSCDFKVIMSNGLNPLLQAMKYDQYGTVYALDDFGTQYGVDYFNTSLVKNGAYEKPLSNPETRQEGLQEILEDLLLPHLEQNTIIHQEFLQNDILFVVVYVPGASNLVQQSGSDGSTKREDYQESYYIFAAQDRFYFVYYFITPMASSNTPSPSNMQAGLDEFYRGCHFQP